jgi:hypothetical protein
MDPLEPEADEEGHMVDVVEPFILNMCHMIESGLSMCPPARPLASPGRPPRPPDKEIFDYIRVYSSIFEYIQGIFKEYSENMYNMPNLCPV